MNVVQITNESEVLEGIREPISLLATKKVEESKTDKSSGRNGPLNTLKNEVYSAETGEKVPGIKELQIIDQST